MRADNHGTIARVKKEKVSVTIRIAEPGDARAIAEMSREHIESGLGWRYDPAHILRAMQRRESVVLAASTTDSRRRIARWMFAGSYLQPRPDSMWSRDISAIAWASPGSAMRTVTETFSFFTRTIVP